MGLGSFGAMCGEGRGEFVLCWCAVDWCTLD